MLSSKRDANGSAQHGRPTLLDKSQKRGGSAGALGKRRQRASHRLWQHHAHAGKINGHQQNKRSAAERVSSATAASMPSPPAAVSTLPMPTTLSRPSLSTQPRRERRAGHVADRTDGEGKAENERRQAVKVLQHERRARNPCEQSGVTGGGQASISEIGADCAQPARRISRIDPADNGSAARCFSVSGSSSQTMTAPSSAAAASARNTARQPNHVCKTPPIDRRQHRCQRHDRGDQRQFAAGARACIEVAHHRAGEHHTAAAANRLQARAAISVSIDGDSAQTRLAAQ